MEIRFLNPGLQELHTRMHAVFELAGESANLNVFGYELAYAEGRDPFPQQEALLYLDLLKPYLDRTAPPPARVLDVGGGTGRIAVPLAEAGYEVTLLEPAAAGMEIARRRAEAAGVEARLSYVCGEASDAPELGPASFDVVLGIQSLLYLDPLQPVLSDLALLARAAVCFDVPSYYGFLFGRMPGCGVTPANLQWFLEHRTPPGEETLTREIFRCYRAEELTASAEAAGLQVDQVLPVSFLEVLGWQGAPDDPLEKELEQRLRRDRVMQELAAFHLVLARPRRALGLVGANDAAPAQ